MRVIRFKPDAKVKMIFGILLLALGLWISFSFALPDIKKGQLSKDWSRTDGKIISSEVIKNVVKRKRRMIRRGRRKRTSYRADVKYSYAYNEKKYFGSNVMWAMGSSSNSSDAYKIVEKYAVGSEVDVFVNPLSPNEAVLEKGVSTSSKIKAGIGCVFILVGSFLLLFSRRKA